MASFFSAISFCFLSATSSCNKTACATATCLAACLAACLAPNMEFLASVCFCSLNSWALLFSSARVSIDPIFLCFFAFTASTISRCLASWALFLPSAWAAIASSFLWCCAFLAWAISRCLIDTASSLALKNSSFASCFSLAVCCANALLWSSAAATTSALKYWAFTPESSSESLLVLCPTKLALKMASCSRAIFWASASSARILSAKLRRKSSSLGSEKIVVEE